MAGFADRLRSAWTWVERAAVALGVAAIVVALLLAAFGGLLPEPVRAPIAAVAETLGQSLVAWALALAGSAYAVWRVVRGRRREAIAPELGDRRPEEAMVDFPRTGNRFEAIVADHAALVDQATEDGERIRSALADVVVDVETRGNGPREDELEAAIRTGDWTDDRVAAAFLGGDGAPGYPLRERVRGWLRPGRAFQRRVERTVDEIYRRTNRRTTGSGAGSEAGARSGTSRVGDPDRSTGDAGIDDDPGSQSPGDPSGADGGPETGAVDRDSGSGGADRDGDDETTGRETAVEREVGR